MKKILSIVFAACLLTACLLSLTGCNGTAFTVNGLRVETEELLYVMRDNEAIVMFDLEEEFGVNADAADFWETPQNGVDTLGELQKRAQTEIVREKIEQLLAEDAGIHTQLTYSGQLRELEAINVERSQAAAAGEIIYGPVIRNFVAYKASLLSDMRRDLKEALRNNGTLVVTDKELDEAFEERKDDLLENNTEKVARARLLEELYDDAYEALVDRLAAEADVNVKVTVTYKMFTDYE